MTALARAVGAPATAATLTVTDATGGSRELRLAGRLDAYSISGVWALARAEAARTPNRSVVIEASGVVYCDGAGVAMLVDLLRQERSAAAPVTVRGLKPEFQTLLDQFDPAAFRPPAAAPPERLHAVEEIGRAALIVWRDMVTQIAFVGETSAALWFAIRHPDRVRWKDVWYTCEQVGANALPIVALISFLIGMIIAFQSAVPMRQYGAELFVADLVALAILRELGPLMTAILLAGRSGAAFAAEIGTMKVNEELNALTTMGLDPVRFLVVTRILAALLMVPLLTLFANIIGILGGALTMISFNIPILTYLREVDSLVDIKDLWAGMAKTPAFAILIAGIGCLRGLQTETGAAAVGISATRAVVSGIILLVVVDGVYAFIYYLLDI
ncbi:MAG TPA: MlaE family lipid ABC transporter permease subunit [Casimicrobiaceae bacterium]|nr:MlaE family lipid ABC transporter permease subunit [Casimicrobiaceae bacterium]